MLGLRSFAPSAFAALVTLALGLPARGQSAHHDERRTEEVAFDDAIALADRAPRVEGAERSLAARTRGDADIAGDSQGLTIQATPGVRVFDERDRGFEGQLSVAHTWNLGDLTGARRRAASVEQRVLGAEVRAEALQARLQAAHRWIALWQVGALALVLAEEQRLAEELVAASQRGVLAGTRTELDAAEASGYRADVALREVALEGVQHDASVALAVAMARPPTGELRAAGQPPTPPLPSELEGVVARADSLPAVVAARLTATAERAREVEAAANYAPLLSLGAQVQRESPSGFIAQGTATLWVPLFDQGQRARSALLGEAERREGEAGQARLDAQETLSLAVHEVHHQREEERAVLEGLLPALTRLSSLRERALAAGEGTVFEWLETRRRLLEAQARAVEARANRTWAEVRMWILLAELARAEADAQEAEPR